MPAINTERLSAQIQELVVNFHQPPEFIRKCSDIFEFYSDRTRRKNSNSGVIHDIPQYFIPQQIIQEIINQLRNKAQSAPLVLLNLCSALWEINIFESKLLACKILGLIPIEYSDMMLALAKSWLDECKSKRLYEIIIKESLDSIRKEKPSIYLNFFKPFITSKKIIEIKIGLLAISFLLEEDSFFDYPSILQVLKPIATNFPQEVTLDIISIFTLLSKKSPNETFHFIDQLNSLNPNSNFQIILRSIISYFSGHHQTAIRNILNKN